MGKECWQLKNPQMQTTCFKEAFSASCSVPDCAVEQNVQGLKLKGEEVDCWSERLLSHTVCRISSESVDNREYLERTGQTGSLSLLKWYIRVLFS
jgi:hypothetical protein